MSIGRSWPGGISQQLLDYLSGKPPIEMFYPSKAKDYLKDPQLVNEMINMAVPVGEGMAPFMKGMQQGIKHLMDPEYLSQLPKFKQEMQVGAGKINRYSTNKSNFNKSIFDEISRKHLDENELNELMERNLFHYHDEFKNLNTRFDDVDQGFKDFSEQFMKESKDRYLHYKELLSKLLAVKGELK